MFDIQCRSNVQPRRQDFFSWVEASTRDAFSYINRAKLRSRSDCIVSKCLNERNRDSPSGDSRKKLRRVLRIHKLFERNNLLALETKDCYISLLYLIPDFDTPSDLNCGRSCQTWSVWKIASTYVEHNCVPPLDHIDRRQQLRQEILRRYFEL